MNVEYELKYKGEKLKGVLLNEDEDFMTLKLSSGYNANLKKSNLKIISKKEIKMKNSIEQIKKEPKKDFVNIKILHTGGTIASKVDYRTGAVSSKYSANELLSLYPQLHQKANISAKMITNIFSEDMRFHEYNLLLEEIKNSIKQEKLAGIIIAHGTDTMHYSSAALQYSLENLPIPVILVGSQRSSDRASSDAYSNLNAAVDFIINNSKKENTFRRVGICMHETISDDNFIILDAINARKMHSTRRDAFKQINYLPFAKIENDKITILRKELLSFEKKDEINYTKYDENLKIGFFKAHPNTFADELEIYKYYDILILEGTGVGNIAQHEDNMKNDGKILNKLKELSKTTKIIATVQTIYGEVSLDIYSRGRDIQNAGVIGNRTNLTSETLFVRAAYCLSKDKKNFDKLWKENLEGFEKRSIDIEND